MSSKSKDPDSQFPSHGPKKARARDKAQDSSPKSSRDHTTSEQGLKPLNTDSDTTPTSVGMMAIPRNRTDDNKNNSVHDTEPQCFAPASLPDGETPLDRWLAQGMSEDPYQAIGFVQVGGFTSQEFTIVHTEPALSSVDANVPCDDDEEQMDSTHNQNV